MSHTPAFRTVLRGYEPAQVEQRTAELVAEIRARREDVARLSREVEQLHRALEGARREHPVEVRDPELPTPTSYLQLGARIGQVLALAEEEAADMVARAEDEAGALRAEAEAAARLRRSEADRYDAAVRADAQTEAERLHAEAQREAEELLDGARRDAAVRREEAEALWEGHRAKAAQAAADFELTLATRRDRAEQEFRTRTAAAEHQLEAVERAAAHARAQSEREMTEATARIRAMLTDAHVEADRVVGEARERAERLRADSDRELTAAASRRDSINAQLTNVRQMLATLSGSVPVIGFEDVAEQVQQGQAAEVHGQDGSQDGPAPAQVDLREAKPAAAAEERGQRAPEPAGNGNGRRGGSTRSR
jgi:cell division septum initiation protein DivIVA